MKVDAVVQSLAVIARFALEEVKWVNIRRY